MLAGGRGDIELVILNGVNHILRLVAPYDLQRIWRRTRLSLHIAYSVVAPFAEFVRQHDGFRLDGVAKRSEALYKSRQIPDIWI